jgi:hypothetical protein
MASSSGKLKGGGTVAVSLLGAGVVGLALWFCVHPHLLAAHYHAWRLAEAKTFEEARPWLEALAGDCQKPEACEAIVGRLREDQEKLTFWFFASVLGQPPESMLPLLQGFTEHLDADERLLSLWAHFLLWRSGRGIREKIDASYEAAMEAKDSQFGFLFEKFAISDLTFHQLKAMNLASAWFFGLRPLPTITLASLKKAKTWEDVEVASGDRQIGTWLREEKPYLRFRQDVERFVKDEGNYAKPDPSPLGERFSLISSPFPHWEGPIPEIPGFPEHPRFRS